MRSTNIKYIPELDQLRGAAALLVLFFHAIAAKEVVGRFLGTGPGGIPLVRNPAELVVANGFTGVALFFVISGFIFTWGALQAGGLDIKAFFTNRFLRIYPLYLLFVITAVCLAHGQVSLQTVVEDLAGLGNLGPALGHFDVVLWTISVELQFYLLFPWLFGLLRRHGVRYLLGLIAILVLLRFIARAALVDLASPVYWTLLGRLDQFLVGMVVAWLVYQQGWLGGPAPARWRLLRRRLATPVLGLALMATSALLLAGLQLYTAAGWKVGNSPWLVVWPTLEAISWAAIGLSYVALARRLPARLLWPLQLIGTISYSLYLLHYPIIKALYRQGLVFTIPGHGFLSGLASAIVLVLPVSIAAALLTYYVVERPPLALRRRYTPSPGI